MDTSLTVEARSMCVGCHFDQRGPKCKKNFDISQRNEMAKNGRCEEAAWYVTEPRDPDEPVYVDAPRVLDKYWQFKPKES